MRKTLVRLHEAKHEAYLVGGCVRDLLLGKEPGDYDVATSARPEAVLKLFPRVVPTGLQHGTVTVIMGPGHHDKVEVTTYRGEGEYTDGRRPDHVEFIDDLDRDLARRDFTVNAIAFDPTEARLCDPFGGVADLRAGLLRAVGDATARFSEDGLRTLRAVRFASVLQFELDAATQDAIPACLPTFRKVAPERVRDELDKMLTRSPQPSRGVELLVATQLLHEIIPEAMPVSPSTLRVIDQVPAKLSLRWAAFFEEHVRPQQAAAILERLKHPRKLIETVALLVREQSWRHDRGSSDAAMRRHVARIGYEHLDELLALREANALWRRSDVPDAVAEEAEFRARALAVREARPPLTMQELAMTGTDLMKLAERGPGAYVGVTLRALLEHVLDHPGDNTKERLEAIARTLLAAR